MKSATQKHPPDPGGSGGCCYIPKGMGWLAARQEEASHGSAKADGE